jgi:hypothetical protein
MRSKVAQRIISETPESVKQKVKTLYDKPPYNCCRCGKNLDNPKSEHPWWCCYGPKKKQ